MTYMTMEHVGDPREAIRDAIGDLSNVDIFFNWVLVAVYKRPEKTKSGIILTDDTRKEDEYQGKAGLVLKKGVQAFVDDANTSFQGQNVNVGDWVVIRPSDGWQVMINGVLCRMVQDVQVRLRIPSPDTAF
jgi:co-chaperonin GroES (HSP10)